MQLDFSKEKTVAVIVAIIAYFLTKSLNLPYWVSITALIVIVGWGPDIWRRLRS